MNLSFSTRLLRSAEPSPLVLRTPPNDPIVRVADRPLIAMVGGSEFEWVASGALDAADRVVTSTDLVAARLESIWAPGLTTVGSVDVCDGGDLAVSESSLPHVGRVGISTCIRSERDAEFWGDLHFARALGRALRRRGVLTRILLRPDWGTRTDLTCDVVIHLRGLTRRPVHARRQKNMLWVISHPERLEPGELDDYDWIVSAGSVHARSLAAQSGRSIPYVAQAADADTFRPGRPSADFEGSILSVANARQVRRRGPTWLMNQHIPFDLYGRGWHDRPEQRHVVAEHIPNRRLAAAYRSSALVVADHHSTMRSEGFIANRVYDVLAAGGCVVSDDVVGLDEQMGAVVPTYSTSDELGSLAAAFTNDPRMRDDIADRGPKHIAAGHTFDDRVREIVAVITS